MLYAFGWGLGNGLDDQLIGQFLVDDIMDGGFVETILQ